MSALKGHPTPRIRAVNALLGTCLYDSYPETVLKKAQQGRTSDLEPLADKPRTAMDDYLSEEDNALAGYAGVATVEAARAALYDEADIDGEFGVRGG